MHARVRIDACLLIDDTIHTRSRKRGRPKCFCLERLSKKRRPHVSMVSMAGWKPRIGGRTASS